MKGIALLRVQRHTIEVSGRPEKCRNPIIANTTPLSRNPSFKNLNRYSRDLLQGTLLKPTYGSLNRDLSERGVYIPKCPPNPNSYVSAETLILRGILENPQILNPKPI